MMSEYDADTMTGLMPQIMALTAPPGPRDMKNGVQNTYTGPSNTLIYTATQTASSETTGLAAHPYFRRPGKGHNRDSCDACAEGGDLICCDICPASFHLMCHDPPLDEDNIPVGEWICHQCRVNKNDDKGVNNRNGKSVKTLKKKDNEEDNNKVWTSGRQMEVSATPLTILVKEAASSNPKQFSLPYELTLPVNFPNEPKDTFRRNGRRGWGRKKPYELDNGLTPRPAILCFQCNKSCRVGPIIPCDYCNLFYHLDCVNPPLTIPPTGKWMCPSHPEHLVDSRLDSHSLVDRVKIWDKFNGPLDEHSIKLEFIRKCNKERTNAKFKIRKVTRERIKVPNGIKDQYCNPASLLPHLSSSSYIAMPPLIKKATNNINCLLDASDYINTSEEREQLENSKETTNELNESVMSSADLTSLPSEEEKKEWLLSLLQFQSSMFKELSKKCNGAQDKPVDLTKLTNGSSEPELEKKIPILNGDLGLNCRSSKTTKLRTNCQKSKNNRSSKNFKKLPYQNPLSNVEFLSEALTSLAGALREKIEHNTNLKINGFNQSLLEVLAYERILSILTPPGSEMKKLEVPQIPARALLCPLVPDVHLKFVATPNKYSSEPVPMTFRILNIGKGSQNHVNLELFGNCNFISSQHAAIIYDENTGSYELLNYSEHGTRVDGITLNCNFSDKTLNEATTPPILLQLKEMADENRGTKRLLGEQCPPTMTSVPGKTIVCCGCHKPRQNGVSKQLQQGNGWEGTSLLHHGSFMKFGCLAFVFSIVETAVHGEWANDVLSTYEKFIVNEKNEQNSSTQDNIVKS